MRLPLLLLFLAALALSGCASAKKKAAAAEQKAKAENSRLVEQRRMFDVENGTVSSMRGAEIFRPDENKAFDPSAHTATASRNYNTKSATAKSFDSDRQLRLDAYQTRGFWGSKSNSLAQQKFATKDAQSHGYLLPDKDPGNKTAASKQAWDATKVASTHTASDSRRQYLGPESKKLGNKVDPKTLAEWKTSEATVQTDGTVERVSALKQLSIDDIRDLLNKSK